MPLKVLLVSFPLPKARKKPIEQTTPEELGIDINTRLSILQVAEPPTRKAVQIVPDVATLIDRLKNQAKVI